MNTWQLMVINGIIALVGAGGAVQIVQAFTSKRSRSAVRIDVADKVNEMALEVAAAIKQEAVEARVEAKEARAEASQARNEVHEVRRQMAVLVGEIAAATDVLRRWRTAILTPNASIDELRAMVARDSSAGPNGRHV